MDGACSDALVANGLVAGDESVEVNVDTSALTNNISPDDYLVNHVGKKLTVGNIPIDEKNLPGEEVLAVATFNILPLDDGAGNITNLCLYNVSYQDLP